MAPGQDLGDRTTHGVADDDHTLHVERLDEGGEVITATVQGEGRGRLALAPVPPQVGSDHPEPLTEIRQRPIPVKGGRRHPTVQQHDGRRSRRPVHLPSPDGSQPSRLDHTARWAGFTSRLGLDSQ